MNKSVDLTLIINDKPKLATQRWEWPALFYTGPAHKMAGYIISEWQYSDRFLARDHIAQGILAVVILNYSEHVRDQPWRKKLFDNRFSSIKESVQFVKWYLEAHPNWQPTIV